MTLSFDDVQSAFSGDVERPVRNATSRERALANIAELRKLVTAQPIKRPPKVSAADVERDEERRKRPDAKPPQPCPFDDHSKCCAGPVRLPAESTST